MTAARFTAKMRGDALARRKRLGCALFGVLACVATTLASAPGSAEEWILWRSTPGDVASSCHTLSADLAGRGSAFWVARVVAADSDRTRIVVYRRTDLAEATHPDSICASFAGDRPSLLARRDGTFVLAYLEALGDGEKRLVVRHGSGDAASWSAPIEISGAGACETASGRLVETRKGHLVLPVVRRASDGTAAPDAGPVPAEVVCFTSADGTKWRQGGKLLVPGGADPAVAEAGAGTLVLVVRAGGLLRQSTSTNEGKSWSPLLPIGMTTLAAEHALGSGPGDREIAVAWSEAEDSSAAPPQIRPLWLAFSSDAGKTWRRGSPLALWPGIEVAAPVLRFLPPDRLAAVYGRRAGGSCLLCCTIAPPNSEASAQTSPSRPDSGAIYCQDPEAVRRALRVLAAHTLSRPRRAGRLYVEGYFMRSLVAAGAALPDSGAAPEPALDHEAELAAAVAFADSLVRSQNECDYWPLGYGEGWTADMAAAAGIFAALEPYVGEERLGRYRAAAERFVRGLERDRFFLASGALAIGWPKAGLCGATVSTWSSDIGSSHDPYLVSTSLAGIALESWLYHRGHEPLHKQRALAALDYTLSQIQPDGSLPGLRSKEGPVQTAAYVQEGWIAADMLLDDTRVRLRLVAALPPHVDWLLRTQRADGTWGDPRGESARTPAIIDFLVWYDQRCVQRQDVRAAVRRASAAYADPVRWRDLGLFRRGPNFEVLRAVVGRALAAAAGGRFVL